jgi:hypothetical protein
MGKDFRKKSIALFILIMLMGSLNFSCTNTKEGVNTSFLEEEQIPEEIEESSEEQKIEYKVSKSKKPNISPKTPGVYTKEEIQDIGYGQCIRGVFTLYGRTIDYLGQTTTKEGKDLAFIQSAERMNFVEKDGAYSEPLYESDLICLGLNSKSEEWVFDDTTQTLWVYHLKQARIKSICSDEKYVYVGTNYRLDGDNFNESDLCVICLDKETGMQIWKQPIEGSVATDMVLHDSKIYFGVSLPEGGRIYTLSSKDGTIVQELDSSCKGFRSFLSTKDGFYYTTYTYSETLSLCVLHYSFQTQKETVFWNPVTYSGNYKKSNLLLANSVFYYFIITDEIDENGEGCNGIVVFAVEPNTSSSGPNKSKLL